MAKLWILGKKILLNFTMDVHWLATAPVPLKLRSSYLIKKYRAILSGSQNVEFLNETFHYDNSFMPALLTDYVFEVGELLQRIGGENIKTLLDLGSNLGQFSYVFKYMRPGTEIYAFEPNPLAFEINLKNSAGKYKWNVFNFGVGSAVSKIQMHFVPGKTAQTSIHKNNACEGLLSTELVTVDVGMIPLDDANRKRLNVPSDFSLIKIDVEGSEAELLKGLRAVSWKYIYIELSGLRSGAISLEETMALIEQSTGLSPELVWLSDPIGPSLVRQALLKSSLVLRQS